MVNSNSTEDQFLAIKVDIERTVFFITYALDKIYQGNIDEIDNEHIQFLKTTLSDFEKCHKKIDEFIKSNDRIFNIEPSA